MPGNLTVLEDQIDADIQMEYFNYTRVFDKNQSRDEVLKKRDSIFGNDMAVEEKKKLMKNGKVYSGFERKIITSELKFSIKKSGGELEEVRFNREFCMILSVIPLNIPVQVLFDNLIHECNQYGEFLNPDCIITNVRVFSCSLLRKMLRRNKVKKIKPGSKPGF